MKIVAAVIALLAALAPHLAAQEHSLILAPRLYIGKLPMPTTRARSAPLTAAFGSVRQPGPAAFAGHLTMGALGLAQGLGAFKGEKMPKEAIAGFAAITLLNGWNFFKSLGNVE